MSAPIDPAQLALQLAARLARIEARLAEAAAVDQRIVLSALRAADSNLRVVERLLSPKDAAE